MRKISTENAENEEREFSSTQINLPKNIADRLVKEANYIDDDDLGEYGREDEPHVTVKFGLYTNDPKEVKKVLDDETGPIRFKFKNKTTFSPSDGSGGDAVLKYDIESDDLHRLNSKISQLPNGDEHPEYKPHVTLAYVKENKADQYIGEGNLTGEEFETNEIILSGKDYSTEKIILGDD